MEYYADQVVGGRDSNQVAELSWYVDMQFDVPNKTVRVYTTKAWSSTTAAIVQSAATEGVIFLNVLRPKSLNQLVTEQRALATKIASEGVITGSYIIDIDPISETQTTTVTSEGGEEFDYTEIAGADSAEEGADLYEDDLSTEIGNPVEVEVDENGTEVPESTSGRQDDSSPYYGGLGVKTPSGGYCSGSFGGRRVVGTTTTYYMFTAAHCGEGNYKDQGDDAMGAVDALSNTAKSYDVAAIRLTGGRSSGARMFDGGYNDATAYSKPVGGKGQARKGMKLCTSGANSGVHCYLRVYKLNSWVYYDDGVSRFGLIRAIQDLSGTVAAVKGDSGGPFFGPYDGGWDKIKAVGIISGGSTPTTCPPVAFNYSGIKCYKRVFVQPINSALDIYGAQLNYA